MRGYGTRLVWNSVRSTFRAPSKRREAGDGGHNLTDQTVQVGVGGALDVQVAAADVVDGFVVDHEGAVRVLQCGVGGEDGVVGLHHRRGTPVGPGRWQTPASTFCRSPRRGAP